MSASEIPDASSQIQAGAAKSQSGAFYGYNHYIDATRRFLGEERAGSRIFHVFESKKTFEQAVSGYNVLGNPPVKSAALGPA